MQFAFKDKHSTVMCCLAVKEVFDKVKHDKLFELLIERKIPAVVRYVPKTENENCVEWKVFQIIWN